MQILYGVFVMIVANVNLSCRQKLAYATANEKWLENYWHTNSTQNEWDFFSEFSDKMITWDIPFPLSFKLMQQKLKSKK